MLEVNAPRILIFQEDLEYVKSSYHCILMKKLAKEREHDVQQELGSESFNICSTLFLDAIFGFDFPLLLPSLADAVGLSRKRMS